MVDNKVDGHKRVDFVGIAAKRNHGVSHGREINDRRHACEILHENTRGTECNLMICFSAIL